MGTRRSAAEEVVFKPVDNARLAALCGPLDANLRQIETALDVTIRRRGERFAIEGPREKAARAAQALKRFYDDATHDLSIEDILAVGVDLMQRSFEPLRKQGGLDLYFNPQVEEFAPRTTRSLSNAFTSRFKELDPIPQFKATTKLVSFLELATAGGMQ